MQKGVSLSLTVCFKYSRNS